MLRSGREPFRPASRSRILILAMEATLTQEATPVNDIVVTLTTLTPAEIDRLWLEAVAPANAKYERANALAARAASYRKWGGRYAAQADDFDEEALSLRQDALAERQTVEAPFRSEWDRRHGWTRAYVVPGGHIHASTSCHSLHPTTVISWLPDQSGLSEDEIVALAGTHACTICYPSAPVAELLAAEAAAKRATQCPGYGTHDHDSSGLRYASPRARCNHCGQVVSVTSTGKLRAHKPKATT